MTDRNAKRRAWYAANRERVRKKKREWEEANRESVRERHRKWYYANKDRAAEHSRKWRARKTMSKTVWAGECLERLKEMWAAGHSYRAIAAELGVSPANAFWARQYYGLPKRNTGAQKGNTNARQMPDKLATELREMYERGMSCNQISDALMERGISINYKYVWHKLKVMGMQTRSRGEARRLRAERETAMPPMKSALVIERPGWPTKAQLMAGR